MASTRQRGAHHNGLATRPKPSSESKQQYSTGPAWELDNSNQHAHDRLLFLVTNCIGCTTTVTTKTNNQYTGIFSCATLDSSDAQCVLKMTKAITPPSESRGGQHINGHTNAQEEYAGFGDDHAMTFDFKDVVTISVANVAVDKALAKLPNGSSTGFRTDTDISGNVLRGERELKAWEPSADTTTVDISLNGSTHVPWDQFETNERLYNVKTDYDENFYTTAIDRSHPEYRQRAAAAERIAREIEGTASTNAHIAEERGHKIEGAGNDEDEEEKFSGVGRETSALSVSQGNKYTPPARRAPAGQSSVSGAPVDPAIISSQLVKPDANVKPGKPSAAAAAAAASTTTTGAVVTPSLPAVEDTKGLSGASVDLATTTEATQEKPKAEAPTAPNSIIQDGTAKRQLPVAAAAAAAATAAAAPSAQAASTKPPTDSTVDVEQEVLNSFKNFAAGEKLRVQERTKATQRKEKEVKLNDLKKFAAHFKLKTAVPQDMLGILAKDKTKQREIVAKSQRQLEDSTAASQAPSSAITEARSTTRLPASNADAPPPPPPPPPPAAAAAAAAAAAPPTNPRADRQHANHKGSRNSQVNQSMSSSSRSDRPLPVSNATTLSPRGGAGGGLGQRLLMNPAYGHRGAVPNFPLHQNQNEARAPLTGPAAMSTEFATSPVRNRDAPAPSSTQSGRFNAQAIEFKPNPTASTFLPSNDQGTSTVTPAARKGGAAPARPTNRFSIFGSKRPGPASDKESIKGNFNPLAHLKKKAQADKEANKEKIKLYDANNGIEKAHQTNPRWAVPNENESKTIEMVFQKSTPSPTRAHSSHQYQGQLPAQLSQNGQPLSQSQTPLQAPPIQLHSSQGHEQNNHFDDYSMRISASNSGTYPMPRYGPTVPHYGGTQHMSQIPAQFGAPFMMGLNAQPIAQTRQFSQGGHLVNPQAAPPMMMNQSSGGSYMNLPIQNMHMYSPGQGHVVPAHMNNPHTPNGHNGFPSPRQPPMMMHQGSQQGHASYPYMNQIPPMFNQHAAPNHHGRGGIGGVPMQQQQSYGSSPHMSYHFPAQHQHHRGGPQFGNNYPQQQQMHPGQMQAQQRPSTGTVNDDAK